ncbi:MAG: GntR family transcriptional regulator [Bifidobacteriaceae bacterium]|jgi:DNA-binding GntR family transcriptional regulator|nr:GntR family transcriptional regulator [Bifidobacteriaceae bacterium]
MVRLNRRHHRARAVRDAIRLEVLDGAWGDSILPSEDDLAKDFAVGRNVVREALNALVLEGILERRQGIGTQPKSRIILHAADSLRALHEDDERARRGRPIRHRLIDWRIEEAPGGYAAALGLPVGAPIIVYERLTCSDTPLIFWSTRIRGDLGLEPPGERGQWVDIGFYEYIERSGARLGEGVVRTSAAPADQGVAEVLEIAPGDPVLVQSRRVALADGRPLEVSTGYYRPNQVALLNRFSRAEPSARAG